MNIWLVRIPIPGKRKPELVQFNNTLSSEEWMGTFALSAENINLLIRMFELILADWVYFKNYDSFRNGLKIDF